ncbi:reverse transcriptase domain-containing protein [Streptomyces sp. NBC_00057]|uniref:reverse transcriptase domain-containing protein n=1 Tax=Streptomyces sp. NBC_00057 TaxID=2975634 RepID=UPI0032537F5E
MVSPVLANLFLHYAFDAWMDREFPSVWFERYADDAVLHCVTERQARQVLAALADRMAEVGLRLHPAKTRIVYCKDGLRTGSYEHTAFTFLGYTFRARKNRSRHGNLFLGFDPAISKDALKKISREVRGTGEGIAEIVTRAVARAGLTARPNDLLAPDLPATPYAEDSPPPPARRAPTRSQRVGEGGWADGSKAVADYFDQAGI